MSPTTISPSSDWSEDYSVKSGAARAAKKAGVDPSKIEAVMRAGMTFYRYPVPALPAGGPSVRGPAREGSKLAGLAALLRRPGGANWAEVLEATGWQPHTARAVISGKISKLLIEGEVIARWRGKDDAGYAIIFRNQSLGS